jgi:hypothetical protein
MGRDMSASFYGPHRTEVASVSDHYLSEMQRSG